jgi:sigma-E factor negative regulatory protein RseB
MPAVPAGGGGAVLLLAVAVLCLMITGPSWAATSSAGDADSGLGSPPRRGDDLFWAATGPVGPGGEELAGLALLRRQGWSCPMSLPRGMRLILAEERRADGTLDAARGSASPDGDYVHLGYSDGTSVLSVFIQKGRLDSAQLANWHVLERNGHTIWVQGSGGANAIWSSGDYVYTVLADAPADVVDAVVAVLPHEAAPGFWQRVSRGMDRVLAWANPFD